MPNIGEVLSALGSVAAIVERASRALDEADTALGNAHAALTEATGGSNDQDAREAPEYLAIAASRSREVDQLLHGITSAVSAMVDKIRNADGDPVPPGARAARAPVAGRVHPTNTPAPPERQRDPAWAALVGAQLTKWKEGLPTEALVFDAAGQDWQVNSGVDAELTVAAEAVVENLIANGEVGAAADAVTNQAERSALRRSTTHAETKAAVWAAANGKQTVDVVTNRSYVCGQHYAPGDRQNPPGCAQAVAAILPTGYRMRVWRHGMAVPFVITGRGKEG